MKLHLCFTLATVLSSAISGALSVEVEVCSCSCYNILMISATLLLLFADASYDYDILTNSTPTALNLLHT